MVLRPRFPPPRPCVRTEERPIFDKPSSRDRTRASDGPVRSRFRSCHHRGGHPGAATIEDEPRTLAVEMRVQRWPRVTYAQWRRRRPRHGRFETFAHFEMNPSRYRTSAVRGRPDRHVRTADTSKSPIHSPSHRSAGERRSAIYGRVSRLVTINTWSPIRRDRLTRHPRCGPAADRGCRPVQWPPAARRRLQAHRFSCHYAPLRSQHDLYYFPSASTCCPSPTRRPCVPTAASINERCQRLFFTASLVTVSSSRGMRSHVLDASLLGCVPLSHLHRFMCRHAPLILGQINAVTPTVLLDAAPTESAFAGFGRLRRASR